MYIFDTNVFLQIARSYHPDVFPTLWNKLDAEIGKSSVISIEYVKLELMKRIPPHFDNWLKSNARIFTDQSQQEQEFARSLMNSPAGKGLMKTKNGNINPHEADPWIIAKASVFSGIVVTMERRRASSDKPGIGGIPDVCDGLNIKCINLDEFMIENGWRF